jgi:hypothetical protein
MNFRKANISDINVFVQYRKQQLIEEGLPPNANKDKKRREERSNAIRLPYH